MWRITLALDKSWLYNAVTDTQLTSHGDMQCDGVRAYPRIYIQAEIVRDVWLDWREQPCEEPCKESLKNSQTVSGL